MLCVNTLNIDFKIIYFESCPKFDHAAFKKSNQFLYILNTCPVNNQAIIPPEARYDVTKTALTILPDGKTLRFYVDTSPESRLKSRVMFVSLYHM